MDTKLMTGFLRQELNTVNSNIASLKAKLRDIEEATKTVERQLDQEFLKKEMVEAKLGEYTSQDNIVFKELE